MDIKALFNRNDEIKTYVTNYANFAQEITRGSLLCHKNSLRGPGRKLIVGNLILNNIKGRLLSESDAKIAYSERPPTFDEVEGLSFEGFLEEGGVIYSVYSSPDAISNQILVFRRHDGFSYVGTTEPGGRHRIDVEPDPIFKDGDVKHFCRIIVN